MRKIIKISLLQSKADDAAKAHINRVLSDGGVIPDTDKLKDAIKYLLKRPLSDYAVIADANIFGYKLGVDNSHVSKLYSLTSGSDLMQDIGTSQPAISQENGRYVITTDGVDDRLRTDVLILPQPVSSYLAVNVLGSAATHRTIYDGISSVARMSLTSATNLLQIHNGNQLNASFASENYGRFNLFGAKHDSADSAIYLNGVELLTGNPGTNSHNGFTIGASGSYNGEYINAKYGTIVFTKTADTLGQRASMESFINELNGGIY